MDGWDRIGLFLCASLLLQIKLDDEECKIIAPQLGFLVLVIVIVIVVVLHLIIVHEYL